MWLSLVPLDRIFIPLIQINTPTPTFHWLQNGLGN